MEEGFQVAPGKLYGFQGAGDTSNQMFGLMDDVAGTFQSEFESAKARQDGEAKASGKPEKKEEEGAAVEEGASEETEASVADEGGEVSKETVVSEESALLEETAPAESEEAVVAGDELLVAEETEAAPIKETVTEQAEVAEVSAETEEVATAEVAPTEEEALPEEPTEALVEQEPVEEAPEAVVSEENAVAPIEADESEDESALPEVAEETVAAVEKQPAAPVVEEVAEEPVVQQKAVKRPDLPKPQTKPAASEAVVEAPKEKSEPAPAPENFHSILPEDEEAAPRVVRLDSDEARRILAGVQDVAAKSQIQNPVANKVSPRLLEGLKANNAQLARQIEAVRAPGAPLPQTGATTKPVEGRASTSPRQADRPYENPRMEQLKQKVMEQVKFQMKMAMRNKAGEIQLKLKPHMLGNVKVSLLVEQSQVTASFVVENQSTRDLMQRSSAQLHEMLSEQGLEVDQIDVALDDRSGDGGHGKAFASVEEQEAAREYLASFARIAGGEGEEVADGAGSDDAADPDQIVNIVA